MYTAKPAQTRAAAAAGRQFGDEDGAMISYNHHLDFAAAVDEQPYLSIGFKGKTRQGAGQLGSDNCLGRNPAPVKLLESFDVPGSKPAGVTVDLAD
ncbi:MAG: hypothetical protein ACLFVT_05130 [Syntrophobacteria bacterium]